MTWHDPAREMMNTVPKVEENILKLWRTIEGMHTRLSKIEENPPQAAEFTKTDGYEPLPVGMNRPEEYLTRVEPLNTEMDRVVKANKLLECRITELEKLSPKHSCT